MTATASDLARQLGAKRCGAGWSARCPAHDDHRASLSIGEGEDGRLLLHCFAGCDFADIMDAAGVEPDKPNGHAADGHDRGRIVATYDYRDLHGEVVFQVVRFEPKSFGQRRPDGKGGWKWGRGGRPPLPYRLPELIEASEVYVVEGEKDADRLAGLGIVATTNPGGADKDGEGGKKWPQGFARYFEGRHVVIIPDNDDSGRRHAPAVASKLADAAASIRILELSGLPPKGDVSDWLDQGHTAAELRELAAAVPDWEPGDVFEFTLLRDLKPRLERRELIKGVIPASGFGVAYAEPGAGKTAIILDMALHVAAGMSYRDRRVEPQPVIFVALEGHGGIGNRVIAAAGELGIEDVPFAVVTVSADFRDPASSVKVARIAKHLGGSPLVVIDTLTAALAGGSDCNPEDVGALIEAVKAELMSQGCTILIIHHSGKDQSRGARGWSGLLAAADFEFEVSREDDLRTLRISKMRDGSDSQPAFCYRLYAVELGKDQHDESVTAVCVEHLADQSGAKRGKRHSPKARAALNVLWSMIKDPSRSFPLPDDKRLRCAMLYQWEAACIVQGVITKCQNERDRRARFRAARKELEKRGAIITSGEVAGYVYPTPSKDRDE